MVGRVTTAVGVVPLLLSVSTVSTAAVSVSKTRTRDSVTASSTTSPLVAFGPASAVLLVGGSDQR